MLIAADFTAACPTVGIGGIELAVDGGGGYAKCLQLGRININPDLTLNAAVTFNPANALQALNGAFHRIIDIPGQLLKRHAGCLDGVGLDGLTFHIDALDDGFVNTARQIAANFGNRILDVFEGLVRRYFQTELDAGGRHAVAHRRGDVFDTVDASDRIFNQLGDL